jgi:hypothetical protein
MLHQSGPLKNTCDSEPKSVRENDTNTVISRQLLIKSCGPVASRHAKHKTPGARPCSLSKPNPRNVFCALALPSTRSTVCCEATIPDGHIQFSISNSQHVEQELGKRIRPSEMDPLSTEAEPFDAHLKGSPASFHSTYGTDLTPGPLPYFNNGTYMAMMLAPPNDAPGSSQGFELPWQCTLQPKKKGQPKKKCPHGRQRSKCRECDGDYCAWVGKKRAHPFGYVRH